MRLPQITRDGVLFVTGLGLLLWEALARGGAEPRPTLLAVYAGMMGLPFVFRADDARRKRNGDES